MITTPTPLTDPTAPAHPQGHAHDADLGTCLDFINTESRDGGLTTEHLETFEHVIDWFDAHGLAHEPAMRAQAARDGAGLLGRVHGARAALRAVWDAEVEHRIPEQRMLDVVNAVLREAPRLELVAGGDCCGIGHRHTTDDSVGEALAGLVGPLVRSIAAGETGRFRICANDGCRWVFEDTSRGGRRRWCDMSSCGNRAKVRRFRSRRKDGGPGDGAAGDAGAPGTTL